MNTWFSYVQIAGGVIAAIICCIEYCRKRGPNDYTLGSTLLLGVLLLVQVGVALVAPALGNHLAGDPLEFWLYLITALILPVGVAFWALLDRRRSANLVLAVVDLTVAIMVYRMLMIWHGSR